MAENQDGAEKSEEATSKKKEDARKEGNVAKSMDLSSGVLLSTVISYFAVNSFNISKPAAYILYLFLFIFLFVLYIAVIFKPFY